MQLNVSLNFGGNCAEALRYYEKHLGARITAIRTFAEMPASVPRPPNAPPMQKDMVMHARMELGGFEVFANDVPAGYEPMRSAYMSLRFDDNAEAERVYAVLKDGGQVFMALEETFFAHRFAMLRDRFGVNWMLLREKRAAAG
jgi:PhnB protein